MSTALVWFRRDLRLADNPALYLAAEEHDAVIPVFIWAPEEEGDWPPGGAHRWWLHHALEQLDADLRGRGSRLVLRRGKSLQVLRDLIEETGAATVYWNKRYEPALRARDLAVAEALREDFCAFASLEGYLLHDPERIETSTGGPYRVFTPFWKRLKGELDVPDPISKPRIGATKAPGAWPTSLQLDALELLPKVGWAGGLRDTWQPGEAAAQQRLQHFLDDLLIDYEAHRNRPGLDGTSMLSPYLHHGHLSPRQVWTAVEDWVQNKPMREAADAYLREIAWREFSYHMLYHFPHTPGAPLKDKFAGFAWKEDDALLECWQQGRTGYPIVDAGMRQLWQIGWMHNRVRMIVASFLTKDLLQPWQRGAAWFWDTLVDGDLANNTMGWQWSAGSGADAQPFFRIFNPVSQGQRYDPDGAYVRRWVPELAKLPDRYLHAPWTAPPDARETAGIRLGEDYPAPLVDHSNARERALEAYQRIK
jgi:deoxyribodipyrimidine photo-lyase